MLRARPSRRSSSPARAWRPAVTLFTPSPTRVEIRGSPVRKMAALLPSFTVGESVLIGCDANVRHCRNCDVWQCGCGCDRRRGQVVMTVTTVVELEPSVAFAMLVAATPCRTALASLTAVVILVPKCAVAVLVSTTAPTIATPAIEPRWPWCHVVMSVTVVTAALPMHAVGRGAEACSRGYHSYG